MKTTPHTDITSPGPAMTSCRPRQEVLSRLLVDSSCHVWSLGSLSKDLLDSSLLPPVHTRMFGYPISFPFGLLYPTAACIRL
jgi:hypothetical protein